MECHDNATVFDYFDIVNPAITLRDRLANSRLALHLVLLAQGVPFIHSGQEFFRTKNLIDNTYNMPDEINKLDWLRSLHYTEDIAFVKQLIAFRRAHPLPVSYTHLDVYKRQEQFPLLVTIVWIEEEGQVASDICLIEVNTVCDDIRIH